MHRLIIPTSIRMKEERRHREAPLGRILCQMWGRRGKYKRTIWQCNAKLKGESRCATPHLYGQRIKELFLEALGILMADRETVIADCRAVMCPLRFLPSERVVTEQFMFLTASGTVN